MPIPPYGGKLVNRVLPEGRRAKRLSEVGELQGVDLDAREAFDADKISIGAYSPLEGFMTSGEYLGVLHGERLENGLPWTIPVVICPDTTQAEAVARLNEGDDVALRFEGRPIAILALEDKYTYSKEDLATSVYGTKSASHPDVRKLENKGTTLLGGKIKLLERVRGPTPELELTPQETRDLYGQRGWGTIAAYQTRNPPHMAHEYIQRCALEMVDGLQIHPVVGELKEGDFPAQAIVRSYQLLFERYYPADRVALSTLAISMRYAGPKAAVFLATIRRNYGCTHFISGRDVAGVGDFYPPYEAHEKLRDLDIGVEPILFEESFYCRQCGGMASCRTCGHYIDHHMKISMTEIRNSLGKGELPPTEIMRPEIATLLFDYGSSIVS
jgi:sulfate adenylyltransferase